MNNFNLSLTITMEEAITLRIILACVGGCPKTSARKFSDRISQKLIKKGFVDFLSTKDVLYNHNASVDFNDFTDKIVEEKAKQVFGKKKELTVKMEDFYNVYARIAAEEVIHGWHVARLYPKSHNYKGIKFDLLQVINIVNGKIHDSYVGAGTYSIAKEAATVFPSINEALVVCEMLDSQRDSDAFQFLPVPFHTMIVRGFYNEE